MGCGASTPAPPAAGDAAPEKPHAAGKAEPPPPAPGKSVPPGQTKPPPADSRAQPKPQPAAASSSAAPTSTALPARIRTEELIKLCQSSHFDRTQASPRRPAAPSPAPFAWCRRSPGRGSEGVRVDGWTGWPGLAGLVPKPRRLTGARTAPATGRWRSYMSSSKRSVRATTTTVRPPGPSVPPRTCTLARPRRGCR